MNDMWMISLALLLGAILLIGFFGRKNPAQAQHSDSFYEYLRTEYSDSVLLCTLTDEALLDRKQALTEQLKPLIQQVIEHDQGYSFVFPHQDGLAEQLLFYIQAEQKCCSFFHMDLSFLAFGGGIVVRISGPPGAKRFMEFLAD